MANDCISHRKKREAKIKRDVKRGIREANEQSPFEIFVTVTDIRYTYYKESHKILGQTYGMLVLQDFEALTPNLLARTIETVEGGGLVVLLLKTMSSLRQLYNMTMDVHKHYTTAAWWWWWSVVWIGPLPPALIILVQEMNSDLDADRQ